MFVNNSPRRFLFTKQPPRWRVYNEKEDGRSGQLSAEKMKPAPYLTFALFASLVLDGDAAPFCNCTLSEAIGREEQSCLLAQLLSLVNKLIKCDHVTPCACNTNTTTTTTTTPASPTTEPVVGMTGGSTAATTEQTATFKSPVAVSTTASGK